MSAAAVLERARRQGVELSAGPDGKLRWRCPAPLDDGLRADLAAHKAALLALLAPPPAPPWDAAEAGVLVALLLARREEYFGPGGYPADPAARGRLAALFGRVDAAWLARDLPALRQAAAEALAYAGRLAAAEALRPAGRGCPGCYYCQPAKAQADSAREERRGAGRGPAG
jgi:hypothetical protein